MIDSIVKPPPLPSFVQAQLIEQQFEERADDFCNLPGSIVHFSDDSTCYNPLQLYISNYRNYQKEKTDSAQYYPGWDSIVHLRYLVALYTYSKFSVPKKRLHHQFAFSHDVFLAYLEEEQEIQEKSWLVRFFGKVFDFINSYILQPLLRYIIRPIAQLTLFWKMILFIISIALFIFVIVTVARFAVRFFPDRNQRKTAGAEEKGAVLPGVVDWLARARHMIEEGAYGGASECVYRHLLFWTLDRNRIRRYEWWTNRYLLNVIKKRFNSDYGTAKDIVRTYEHAVYGHNPADKNSLEQLIARAGQLKGKKST